MPPLLSSEQIHNIAPLRPSILMSSSMLNSDDSQCQHLGRRVPSLSSCTDQSWQMSDPNHDFFSSSKLSTKEARMHVATAQSSSSIPSFNSSPEPLSETHVVPPQTSRSHPYFSTMMTRNHIRRPGSVTPPRTARQDAFIRRGQLYEQLRAKGVTDEVAYERQRIYNRLNAIVNSCNDQDL
jgi:hypothetical protein